MGFFFVLFFVESTSGLYADWLARRQQSRSYRLHDASGEERNVGFSCLTWLYGLFVTMKRSYQLQTHMPAAVDPHSNFIEGFDLGRYERLCAMCLIHHDAACN